MNLVELAVQHALQIHSIAENAGDKNASDRLRSRVRSLPSLVSDVGLVQALLFYLSKAGESENVYRDAYKVFATGGGEVKDSINEKGSYAVVAAAVFHALSSIMNKIGSQNNISPEDIEGAIRLLNKIVRENLEVRLQRRLHDYLITLKRAGEALLPSGESGEGE